MDTISNVYLPVWNKLVVEVEAGGISVHRESNSNSFCGIWVQSISRPKSVQHTSNAAVLLKCGKEGGEREIGERSTVTRAGILILKGCEI